MRLWESHFIQMRKKCWDWLPWAWMDDSRWWLQSCHKSHSNVYPIELNELQVAFAILLSFLSQWTRKTKNIQLLWSPATKESVNRSVPQDWDGAGHLLRLEETFRQTQQDNLMAEIVEAAFFHSCEGVADACPSCPN